MKTKSRAFPFLIGGIVLLICIVSVVVLNRLDTDEKFFTLPEGFSGPVLIIYNQPDGKSQIFEGDIQIFEIPENGVLITQASMPKGLGDDFWYRNESGERIRKLRFFQNCVGELEGDPIVVCVLAESLIINNEKPPRHDSLIVGPWSQIDQLGDGSYEWKRQILLTFLP